jgi:hypothetical protein
MRLRVRAGKLSTSAWVSGPRSAFDCAPGAAEAPCPASPLTPPSPGSARFGAALRTTSRSDSRLSAGVSPDAGDGLPLTSAVAGVETADGGASALAGAGVEAESISTVDGLSAKVRPQDVGMFAMNLANTQHHRQAPLSKIFCHAIRTIRMTGNNTNGLLSLMVHSLFDGMSVRVGLVFYFNLRKFKFADKKERPYNDHKRATAFRS